MLFPSLMHEKGLFWEPPSEALFGPQKGVPHSPCEDRSWGARKVPKLGTFWALKSALFGHFLDPPNGLRRGIRSPLSEALFGPPKGGFRAPARKGPFRTFSSSGPRKFLFGTFFRPERKARKRAFLGGPKKSLLWAFRAPERAVPLFRIRRPALPFE